MTFIFQVIFGVILLADPARSSPWSLDELFELVDQPGLVTDTAYAPNGNLVVSCGVKGTVFAWDPATGLSRWSLATPQGNFSRVAISRDGKLGAVVGLHFVGLFDVAHGSWLKTFTLPNNGSASAVAISDSNLLLAVGSSDSHLWLIDLPSNRITDFAAHDWGIMDLRFMAHDQFLLAGDATSVRVWNIESHTDQRIVDTERGDIPQMFFLSHMSFSDDGSLVLVSSGNDAVLFDLVARQLRQRFTGHDKEVVSLRISPDLQKVVTSSRDHSTRIWDTESGEPIGVAVSSDFSFTAAMSVSPHNDQFIMSAALFDIFGGTVRAKLGIWAIHSP